MCTAEILDAKEVGFCFSVNWVVNVTIGTLSLYSIDYIGIYGNFLLYSGLCAAMGTHLLLDMIETHNLTREEIKDLYMASRPGTKYTNNVVTQ